MLCDIRNCLSIYLSIYLYIYIYILVGEVSHYANLSAIIKSAIQFLSLNKMVLVQSKIILSHLVHDVGLLTAALNRSAVNCMYEIHATKGTYS